MDVYSRLCEDFAPEEQQMFIDHIRCHLTYDTKNDHVINLEHACKFIGFTRKDNGKRLLTKWINETEYIIKQERNADIVQRGGHTKETILLTPRGFKELCMRAGTERALRVRLYYIKIEEMLMKMMTEEIEEKNRELEALNTKIAYLENVAIKAKETKKSRASRFPIGDVVYVIKHHSLQDVFKVGCTDNLNNRFKAYYTASVDSEVVHARRCLNKRVLETAVHHSLSKYRYEERKDWFKIDFNTVRDCVDRLQLAIDGELVVDDDSEVQVQVQDEPNACDIAPNHVPLTPNIDSQRSSSNFTKFFEECFIPCADGTTTWIDITARYRLWSRKLEDMREDIKAYLLSKGYHECFVFDTSTNANVKAWWGFSMKPMESLTVSENSSYIEQFLYDTCTTRTTARVFLMDLNNRLGEWMKSKDPNFEKLSNLQKKELKMYCSDKFVAAHVHNGEKIRFGFYGLCFKENVHVGRKFKNNNRKIVEQVNVSTGEVLKTFASLTQAGKDLNIDIAKLSRSITCMTICNGFRYRYARQDE